MHLPNQLYLKTKQILNACFINFPHERQGKVIRNHQGETGFVLNNKKSVTTC